MDIREKNTNKLLLLLRNLLLLSMLNQMRKYELIPKSNMKWH